MKVIDEMNIKTLFTDVDGNYLTFTPVIWGQKDRLFELEIHDNQVYSQFVTLCIHDLMHLRDKLSEVIEQYGKDENK